jgi:hypothetical protein
LSGLTEIFVILLIVVALFFLPRMASRSTTSVGNAPPASLMKKLSGRRRLAILASLLWLTAMALWLEPWVENRTLFVGIGAVPVIACWGGCWVISGFRKQR